MRAQKIQERREKLVAFLRQHLREKGYPASLLVMSRKTGSCIDTVRSDLSALSTAGVVYYEPGKRRAVGVSLASAGTYRSGPRQ